ncbi:MAG: Dabb family protein [Synechococcaceae cyanobacterium]
MSWPSTSSRRSLQLPLVALAGFLLGFTMTFLDAAARDAYLPHPLLQAVVAKLLPMLDGALDRVVAFDFINGVMGGCPCPGTSCPRSAALFQHPTPRPPPSTAPASPTVPRTTTAARIRPSRVARRRTSRCDAVLASAVAPGAGSVFFAPASMAISTAPRCEIRTLVMHVYPVALGLLRSSWHQGLWP